MNVQIPRKIPIQDRRCEDACTWAEHVTGTTGALSFSVASADASFRRYFRAEDKASGARWIVMDAPPEREALEPFIDISRRLRDAGLHAPEVLAENREHGFLLLSDLGYRTFLDAIDDKNADELFCAALDALVRMQANASASGLPAYDEALLRRELDLYPDWYLARHCETALDPHEREAWDRACDLLVDSALSQPRVFVHRDFMPRNLMLSDPMPGVIDFQDAVAGPVTYDVVSLFRDAFLSWPEERIAGWVREYRDKAKAAGVEVPSDFERAFDWMGVQRHLKVIGIFARLHYRDGKKKYLAETPRFHRYVYEVAGRYPELADLVAILRRHEKRA